MTAPIPLTLALLLSLTTNNLFSQLSKAERLIIFAEEYLGKTYKWGGCGLSEEGIDCSCFTHLVFKKILKITIHRNSYNQYRYCKNKIDRISSLQKGDLIFFDVDGKKPSLEYPNGIDHVGIVADIQLGNIKIIHSSINTNGVSYSYLKDKLKTRPKTYQEVFAGGCRHIREDKIRTPPKKLVGKYPIASIRYLNYVDFMSLSREEIAIMRNEIFARYGRSFQSPKFRQYFSQQSWYRDRSVQPNLTAIEKL